MSLWKKREEKEIEDEIKSNKQNDIDRDIKLFNKLKSEYTKKSNSNIQNVTGVNGAIINGLAYVGANELTKRTRSTSSIVQGSALLNVNLLNNMFSINDDEYREMVFTGAGSNDFTPYELSTMTHIMYSEEIKAGLRKTVLSNIVPFTITTGINKLIKNNKKLNKIPIYGILSIVGEHANNKYQLHLCNKYNKPLIENNIDFDNYPDTEMYKYILKESANKMILKANKVQTVKSQNIILGLIGVDIIKNATRANVK